MCAKESAACFVYLILLNFWYDFFPISIFQQKQVAAEFFLTGVPLTKFAKFV